MGRLTYVVWAVFLAMCAVVGCAKHAVRPSDTTIPPQGISTSGLHKMYSGPSHPPPETGVDGDFFLDVSDSLLYGPKTVFGWGSPYLLPEEVNYSAFGPQLWTGTTAPQTEIGNIMDFFLNLDSGTLYGPKSAMGWGAGWTIGADTANAAPPPAAPPATVN